MGGEYLSQCRSAVSYAEKMIAKEMQRIKEMEAKGLNPYETEEKPKRKAYKIEERIELTKSINEKIKQGMSFRKACDFMNVNILTYRKWKKIYNL
jgi:hypothetical protein